MDISRPDLKAKKRTRQILTIAVGVVGGLADGCDRRARDARDVVEVVVLILRLRGASEGRRRVDIERTNVAELVCADVIE